MVDHFMFDHDGDAERIGSHVLAVACKLQLVAELGGPNEGLGWVI
jgi:hypothetical protein